MDTNASEKEREYICRRDEIEHGAVQKKSALWILTIPETKDAEMSARALRVNIMLPVL